MRWFLEKLLKVESIKQYPEDTDLLEDVIIENKQAIEMANIYSGILSSMMGTFASVISNNLERSHEGFVRYYDCNEYSNYCVQCIWNEPEPFGNAVFSR